MSSVKLYYAPGSCSIVPQLTLAYANIAHEAIAANLRDPAARAEYVAKVSPKGQVPVLVVDNEVITEAPAVQTAIAQLAPGAHLLGKTPLDAVRVYEWLNFLSGTVHSGAFTALFRPSRFTGDESGEAAVTAKGIEKLHGHFASIDAKLVGKTFAVGDGFTSVDGYLILFVGWAARFGIDTSGYKELTRVVDALKREAFVQKVLDLNAA